MFHTVLHQVNNPQNIGMIVRSHAAFNGGKVIFSGYDEPYKIKRNEKVFSRSLIDKCELLNFNTEELFAYTKSKNIETVALEITNSAILLPEFDFAEETAILLGSESYGLPDDIIDKCDQVVRIPQFGPVGSMNVAISASICMYEICRLNKNPKDVIGKMYDYKPPL